MSIADAPVRLPIPALPRGFRVAAVHAGIKRNATREDVTLVVSDLPAVAAGVYTTNLVFAAPVAYDRSLTPGRNFRGVAINSGNANACTGGRGLEDAKAMAAAAARHIGATADEVLVLSTGVIGEFLPLEKIARGLERAAASLGSDDEAAVRAARGMMTTDTRPKLAGSAFTADGTSYTLFGMAKGAAMIGPRLATMLGVVLTDAAIEPADAERLLREAAETSFNCVSVDGHMSTNDTVLLLANGAAGGGTLHGAGLAAFGRALSAACETLAREMADDGEGATHVMRIEVTGCASRDEARRVARTIADSPLVKTAVHGADPNWGRLAMAVGRSGAKVDPARLTIRIGGIMVFVKGVNADADLAALEAHMKSKEVEFEIDLGLGKGAAQWLGCDLSREYIAINADYMT